MAVLVFASVIFQGPDRGPAELAVGKPLITIPRFIPRYHCGSAAFESALASAYGPDPIGGVACIGFFGIGTVKSSGPEAPAGIGFFGVDYSGLWRLVSMVQSDGDVAASLPKGFPSDLLRIWSTL